MADSSNANATTAVAVAAAAQEPGHHVHFDEAAIDSPRTGDQLVAGAEGDDSPKPNKQKKDRPHLKAQGSNVGGAGSVGRRLVASLSRTLSALTPGRKRAESEEDYDAIEVPERWMVAGHGKKKKAVKMYRTMLQWRKDNGIDEMLEKPYPRWEAIKKMYPHAMHHRGRQGEFVSIEMPGKMDLAGMRKAGLTPAVMGLHLAFIFEYAFTKIDPREDVQTITVMDCTGLSITQAASIDNLNLIKAVCEVNSYYYPGRAHKILAVNPPRFFGPVFNLIKNVLPNGLDKVVECCSLAELHKYVDPATLPKHLGGTSTVAVGDSELEQGLAAFVQKLNSQTTTAA